MQAIKKLAGQTAIYGLSSIIGRFLNYLLVPLHVVQFTTDQYGVITEMYAYVAFLVVLLTYGMETAYFRFSNKEGQDAGHVFNTALSSIVVSSGLFILVSIFFNQPIANWLKYPNHSEYVSWFAMIVGLDAISSIPMAKLRALNKAKIFALVNLSNVAINIGLNLFFIAYCMPAYQSGESNWLIDNFYSPEIGVGYVFISNLVASIFKFMILLPFMRMRGFKLDNELIKRMLIYAIPLLVAGLAGIVNETLDRVLLKRMLYDEIGGIATLSQLGIYGACYKVSIIISLFIQAFRYAAEPFFFAYSKEKNSKETYAKIMNYFVVVCTTIFLGVLLYMDFIKYFIPNQDYWEGLKVVPILLMANICLGIYYNQSIWYKMTDKTYMGAYIAIMGAIITIVLNIILIPIMGYMGSAWATLICYGAMVLVSYFLGHRHYPIPYQVSRILFYIVLALLIYFATSAFQIENEVIKHSIHTAIILAFIATGVLIEKPYKKLI
jgi:O-antigen/teichoic acid export membrane protein